jgi:putative sigma-54 modulation protein
METRLTVRHSIVPEATREFAIRKVSKLEKIYEGIISCEVVFSEEKNPKNSRRVEILLRVYRSTLKSAAKSPHYREAICGAVEKIERQLKKYKAKLRERYKYQKRQTALAA